MGGKFWSAEEQHYFVHVVMRKSRFNGLNGTYDPSIGMSWADLAVMMQGAMKERGIFRREYTGNMLYEHWHQTVKKDWGEVRLKIAIASARGHSGSTGREPRSRARKANKRRSRATPPPSLPPQMSNRRSNFPTGPQNNAISGPYSTELPRYTSNHPQMGDYSVPESSFTGFQSPNTAPGRYFGPSMTSGPPSSGLYNPYGASDTPYLTHAEGAALYHQESLPEDPEQRQIRHFPCERQLRRDSIAPAAFNQALNRPQRQHIIIREPTPEDDGSSLFVQQSEHESRRRGPAPRPRMELDAAHTMTMFREQEMHSLHGTPVARHQGSTEARRGLMYQYPYEHQSYAFQGPRLAPIITPHNKPRLRQNQGRNWVQLDEDEDNEEH
ncbi:hypothetical protein SBOR_4434 [Sclerotinia borealis F-4128]|uniref:Uncharacterized protein n=1 Tax=Sclerotinia borealis (strain F-4128) TaxID=1432307 RepID=W9CKX1_SCLBF|nr:hypothetical protein SBOR_4434 [Sclerotinia borealis F-4128]